MATYHCSQDFTPQPFYLKFAKRNTAQQVLLLFIASIFYCIRDTNKTIKMFNLWHDSPAGAADDPFVPSGLSFALSGASVCGREDVLSWPTSDFIWSLFSFSEASLCHGLPLWLGSNSASKTCRWSFDFFSQIQTVGALFHIIILFSLSVSAYL